MVKEGYKEVQLLGKNIMIPEEWEVNKLNGYIDVLSGYSFSSDKFNNEEDGLPLIRIRDIQESEISTYFNGEYDEKYIIDRDDILIGMDGNFYVEKWDNNKALLNQRVCRVESKSEKLDQNYLYYRIKPEIDKIHRITPATTVKHLSIKDVKKTRIPFPPLSEQKKIASILSSVDKSIEKTDEVIEETKELKKGLMQALLTKGIEHSEFKEVKVRAKSISIPKDWELVRLKNITDISGGYAFKSKDFIDEKTEDSYQVIRIGNIQMNNLLVNNNPVYIKEEKLSEREYKYLLGKGEMVITITGTVSKRDYGDLVLIKEDKKYLLNQRIGRINVNNDISNYYVFYYLQTKFFRDQFFLDGKGGTGNQENVSIRDVKKMLIALPPLEEQKKIASILSSVDSKIKKEEEYKAKLERLKKGLMQKLLTGEIRVNTEMEV